MFIAISLPSSNHFGGEGQDLHVILVTQLASHRPEDTGTSGVLVVLDEDGGVVIEADIGAVSTTDALSAADDDGLDNLALLQDVYKRQGRDP